MTVPSTPSPIDRPLGLVIHSGGATAEEKPKVRAERSIYETQSYEARGGSGGSDAAI